MERWRGDKRGLHAHTPQREWQSRVVTLPISSHLIFINFVVRVKGWICGLITNQSIISESWWWQANNVGRAHCIVFFSPHLMAMIMMMLYNLWLTLFGMWGRIVNHGMIPRIDTFFNAQPRIGHLYPRGLIVVSSFLTLLMSSSAREEETTRRGSQSCRL